jgi:hypothetical protein
MTGPASRRGFLSGLVSLPLLGGGVTLIGSPSAVAEPASQSLMSEYVSWLAYEWSRASIETHGTDRGLWFPLHGPAYQWHRERGDRVHASVPPSTRAALVLATVGCDWREGGR